MAKKTQLRCNEQVRTRKKFPGDAQEYHECGRIAVVVKENYYTDGRHHYMCEKHRYCRGATKPIEPEPVDGQ